MPQRLISRRLSRKLLLLTVLFILTAELIVFIPSAITFRQNWLNERAERAGHLALALSERPQLSVGEKLSQHFMRDTNVLLIAAEREGMTELILGYPPNSMDMQIINLNDNHLWFDIFSVLQIYLTSDDGYMRVLTPPVHDDHDRLEFIVPKASLRSAMIDYARRIFGLSIIISIVTGTLLYAVLHLWIVQPVRFIASDLAQFRANPQRRHGTLRLGKREDEIGQLQKELVSMKASIRNALWQKQKLADLGLAVAKINHDLRNILTSAQLLSDRLAIDQNERIAKTGQRLVRTVERGIRLCETVLGHSRPVNVQSDLETITLAHFLKDVSDETVHGLGLSRQIQVHIDCDDHILVQVDVDQCYRLLQNLIRNAAQILSQQTEPSPRITLRANLDPATTDLAQIKHNPEHKNCNCPHENHHYVAIFIEDNGPGLPETIIGTLFTPFVSSADDSGSGLGLSIAYELAQAQGGSLSLSQTNPHGTIFKLLLLTKIIQ